MQTSEPRASIQRFSWLGEGRPHLSAPAVMRCGDAIIGCYGGHPNAGARGNEDGALVWCHADGDWEFALVLDAHASAESAALVLSTITAEEQAITGFLSQPVATAYSALERHLVAHFSSRQFRSKCRTVRGETACLMCARKDQFLWWMSVGDCAAFLLHPELASLGQFTLNQRSFFEWIGQVNTFDLPVPCYASGVRELRSGPSIICIATDGLLQDDTLPFATSRGLYTWLAPDTIPGWQELSMRVEAALSALHQNEVRDSTTIIAWRFENRQQAAWPADLPGEFGADGQSQL